MHQAVTGGRCPVAARLPSGRSLQRGVSGQVAMQARLLPMEKKSYSDGLCHVDDCGTEYMTGCRRRRTK